MDHLDKILRNYERVKADMDKMNLNRFIKEYNSTMDSYYITEEKYEKQKQELKEQKESDKITLTVFNEKVQELDNLEKELKDNAVTSLRELEKEFSEYLTEKHIPNSDDLEEHTIKILKSGILFTDKELRGMADKYKDNPTMTRLIVDYGKARDINISYKAIDEKITSINKFIENNIQAINGNGYMRTHTKELQHREMLVDRFKADIQ